MNFRSNFQLFVTVEKVIFDNCWCKKKNFLGLFQCCSGDVQGVLEQFFGFKMPCFDLFFSSKGWYMNCKIDVVSQNLTIAEGDF